MLPNYVPMGPPTQSSDDGYVDMSPRGKYGKTVIYHKIQSIH